MTKKEIKVSLRSSHTDFITFLTSLDEFKFEYRPHGKWCIGQHADHILRSISPLSKGVRSIPKFLIKIRFGRINRPSLNYESLVAEYLKTLTNGAEASGDFIPGKVTFSNKMDILNSIDSEVKYLCEGIEYYTENDLDEIALPHPILGDISLREMLFFTCYHVNHHLDIIKRLINEYENS